MQKVIKELTEEIDLRDFEALNGGGEADILKNELYDEWRYLVY